MLLDYLANNLPECELPNFKKLKNQIYKEYNNGFYVYAKPDNISSIKQTIDYVVRYYSLYAREHKHSSKIFKLLNQTQIEIREQLRKWNLSIELFFGYNPTNCDCGGHFIFFELKVPTKVLSNAS